MKSNEEIVNYLFETKAFTYLEEPVILTSGEIGIYYVNTEKLLEDQGKFKEYGDNPNAMIDHAIGRAFNSKIFGRVIDILSEKVEKNIAEAKKKYNITDDFIAVGGGQRRDWPFSGAIASNLTANHLAVYKDGSYELTGDHGEQHGQCDLKNMYIVWVADLLTKGSSAVEKWIPTVKQNNGILTDIYHVVTRLQGGEEATAKLGVNSHAEVAIDQDFVKIGQGTPEQKKTAIEYMKNPRSWSEDYIIAYGIKSFVDYFNPESGKTERALKFLNQYKGVLEASGRLEELTKKVNEKYDVNIKKQS